MASWVGTLASGCALLDAARQAEDLADAGAGCEETEACGDDQADDQAADDQADDASDDDAPAWPTANAGPNQTVDLAVVVALNGSQSRAADALTYTWTLSAPGGSDATLSAVDTARTTFATDLEGVYTATLVVSDGQETSAPDSVIITARDAATVGVAGPNKNTYTGTAVTLEGNADEPGGGPVTYQWAVLSAPPGSTAALDDPTAQAPVLVPDQDGVYFLRLVVSRDGIEDAPDVVKVTSYRPLAPLEHRVVDAEYSRSLERIIMVSETPNRLYVLDPESGEEESVALLTPPTSVSVSPDGTHAAVGHDRSVSHVRLTNPARLAVRTVDVDVVDLALADNGYAYLTPRDDADGGLQCLELSSGTVSAGTGWSFRIEGASVKIHPSGTRLYAAENDSSAEYLGVYDIGSGTAQFLRESSYDDPPKCGNLWMSDDGLRIFTRCGRVFRSSPLAQNDMEFNGSLEDISLIRHLDHSSTAGKVAVLPDNDMFGNDPNASKTLRIYGHAFLDLERRIDLPRFLTPEAAYVTHGRFAFISADDTKVFVVVKADETSALLNDHGVVTYDLD